MRRLLTSTVPIFASVLLLNACNEDSTGGADSTSSSNAAAIGETSLQWRLEKGERLTFVVERKMVIASTSMGMQSKSTVETSAAISWVVESVDDDNSMVIRQSVGQITVKLQTPAGETTSYDSTTGETSEEVWSQIPGQEMLFRLDPEGQITELEVSEGSSRGLQMICGHERLFPPLGQKRMSKGKGWTVSSKSKDPFGFGGTVEREYRMKYVGQETVAGREVELVEFETALGFGETSPPLVAISEQSGSGQVKFDYPSSRLLELTHKESISFRMAYAFPIQLVFESSLRIALEES